MEEILERERQAQLQVSTGVLRNSTFTKFVTQRDLEVSVMMPEPLLAPFTDKGQEVSTGVNSGVDTGTENQNRWTNPGPMEIGPATGASGISSTVSGHLRAYTRKVVTIARVKRSHA